jgi:Holliday junction resolvase
MSGRSAKTKGTRVERELVQKLEAEGVTAWRVPMSGSLGGSLSADIKIGKDRGFSVEVKARAGGGGFSTIEKWLGNNQALFLKRDRQEPMVVLEWEMFIELIKAYLDDNGDGSVRDIRADQVIP